MMLAKDWNDFFNLGKTMNSDERILTLFFSSSLPIYALISSSSISILRRPTVRPLMAPAKHEQTTIK
jgi:hypothetical protein